MGSGQSSDSEEEKNMTFENDDSSFIYTAFLILYKLEPFKKYIIAQELRENTTRKMLKLLQRIFSKDEEYKINFGKYSKKLLNLIKNRYKLELGNSPGKILIQILEILNFEENHGKMIIWEDYIMKNQQLLSNSFNQKQALNDFLNENKEYQKTKIAEFFNGILLTRRKLLNNPNIMHFYSYYCVIELDLPYIYQSYSSFGKKMQNSNTQKDEISLIDCLLLMKITRNDIFNGQQGFVENHIYKAPPFLIFLLKRENGTNTFKGDFTFNKVENLSQLIMMEENNKNSAYKLISIVKEKKIVVKKKKIGENKWLQEANNKYKNDKTDDKYLAIFLGENNNYYYINKNKDKNIINIDDKDEDFNYHILVFQKS